MNPFGPDGQRMRCRRCSAEDHFERECPQASGDSAQSQSGANFFTTPQADATYYQASVADERPLAGVLSQSSTVLMMQETPMMYSSSPQATVPWPTSTSYSPLLPDLVGNRPAADPYQARMEEEPRRFEQDSYPMDDVPMTPAWQEDAASSSPRVVFLQPPPEYPPWAEMDTFGFTHAAQPSAPPGLAGLHLFPGALGAEIAPSTLESLQQGPIDMQFATEATLEQWYAHDDRQPTINVTSTTDDSSRSFLDEFFSVQQHNAASLDSQRDKGKARGRGSSPTAVAVPTADADGAIVYDGDDSSCSVCQEAFSSNQWCTRLACHHVFHVGCFNGIAQTGESQSADRCPNCRGPATMIARFRYIAFVSAHVPAAHPLATPHQSRAPSADSFQSVATAFPWQPAAGEQPEGYFHATTQLPGARLGILVDPGAWTNIGGKSHVRRLAQEASNAGHEVQQRKMANSCILFKTRRSSG